MTRTKSFRAACAALALALPSGAQVAAPGSDWRGFRGTDGSATSATTAAGTWSDEENIAWKVPLPGPGTSSPIVVGDAVFLTCWSGYGLDAEEPGDIAALRRHLLRIGRDSGELEWSIDVAPAASEDTFGGRMATHGYASSTPVSDGESVFAFFGKSGVVAVRLDGEELWRADVGTGSSEWKTGSGSSLALCGDVLLVNASDESHSVRALDKASGRELWQRRAPALDQAYGMPVVTPEDSPTVLLALLGEVWGLDPDTGESRWTVQTLTNGALAPTIVLGDGIAYSFGGQTRLRSYAIRLGGEGDVSESHIAWSSPNGCYVTTPLLFDGHLYWVSEDGIAHCTDASTGELVYRERLDGSFYASPVRAGELIYYVSRDSGTHVLLAAPRFEPIANNVLASDETSFDGTPALSDGRLFLRSRSHLYAIEE